MANTSCRVGVPADYRIACVCPMGVELAPVEAMLDTIHSDPLQTVRNQNAYTLGSIGGHNIVIAIMPEIGNNAAAATVTQLLNDFPAVEFGLLVGIGAGVPGDTDVRLGDVVVGQPTGASPAVVQYDMGKELEGEPFQRTGWINKPPAVLSANVRKLDSQHRRLGRNLLEYVHEMLQKHPTMQTEYSSPATTAQDQLYMTGYKHQPGPTCDGCDNQYIVPRPARPDHEPRIHYGTIGSANKVVKNANLREQIRADTCALCIEMEAAGLMSDFSCLVIRGICDYADSHKNKQWQPYAAAVAAAYMKALLLVIPDQDVSTIHCAVEGATSPFKVGLHLIEAPVMEEELFIDRVAELKEMEKILQPQSSVPQHRRLVLGGMGGIGKTQLAIAYARRHHGMYDSIFWLNTASEAVLKKSFRLMAQYVLDVQEYQGLDDDQILPYITRWLLDARNIRWLLVFDNYDEPDTYNIGKYCPYSAHGSTIITTRCPEQVSGRQLLVLPLTDINQGLEILAVRSGRSSAHADAYALNLAKRLQGLPLALATAGAYLKHSPLTFQEYLQVYEKQFNVDTYRSFHLPEYQNRTLYTTWDMTYTRLEADHPKAARLLRSFAFFDNSHLQYELFRVSNDHSMAQKLANTGSRFLTLLRGQEDKNPLLWLPRISVDEFRSIMRVLTEYCLVEMRSTHTDYSIHSCVHDWTLANLNSSTQNQGYWIAFDRIADLVDNIEVDSYALSKHNAITPHAARLTHISFSSISEGISRKRLYGMHAIAGFLHDQGQLDAAHQMYARALAGLEKALGPDHTETLTTAHNLGGVYQDQGKLNEAEQMLTRALAGYEKALGSDHTETLTTVNNLGLVYRDQGKLEEAELSLQHVIDAQRRMLRADHPLTKTALKRIEEVRQEQMQRTSTLSNAS